MLSLVTGFNQLINFQISSTLELHNELKSYTDICLLFENNYILTRIFSKIVIIQIEVLVIL